MSTGLKQESVVELGGKQLRVVSEALLEPEALVVTTILLQDDILKKTHVVIPDATVRDFARRGSDALRPYLHATHLRLVGRLIANQEGRARALPSTPRGVLATLVLGTSGETRLSAGEEQVPGAWLGAVYLAAALADRAGAALGWGEWRRASLDGEGIDATLLRRDGQTCVCLVDRSHEDSPAPAVIDRHIEEVLCAAR